MSRPIPQRQRELAAILRKDIAAGKYRPGTFLPAERKLCDMLNTSRGTLRSTLRVLHRQGLVRINRGRGVYVVNAEARKGLSRFAVRSPTLQELWTGFEGVGLFIGICKGAAQRHAEAIVSYLEPEEVTSNIIARYGAGEIQGIIHPECSDYRAFIAPLKKAGVPYVVANLEYDIPALATRMDFRAVGRQAARHLVELGHRRIGILAGPRKLFLYKEMLAGFRGGLAEDEIYLENRWTIDVQSVAEESLKTALALLGRSDRPTALFASRDVRAMGIYQACRELGLKIPEDLSVISYDDLTWPESRHFGLTTIAEPVERMGAEAVEVLEEWVVAGEPPEDRVFEGELIVRSSTAAPADS